MQSRALLIGNSDGMGLEMTKRMLAAGWTVVGVSKSESPVTDPAYTHHVADVGRDEYRDLLGKLSAGEPFDLCIYFAGMGAPLNLHDMSGEARIIEVNLTGMVKTAAAVIPEMVKRGRGHFIGISSLADELLSPIAPSYNASKAGFSNYLGGLAMAVKPAGVHVTNVRFGFVDTKMAKSDRKPFMMSVQKAADHLEYCLRRKPASFTAPKIMVPFIKMLKLSARLSG